MKKNRPSSPSPLPQVREGCSPPRPACGERGLLENAKQLRSNQTDAEQKLWYHLRAHRCMGLKFKRQKPVGRYIVDFACVERKLIIELDGGQHAEQHEYDTTRDAWLRSEGFTVLRFWNNEVMLEMESVLEKVRLTLSPVPSPASGRGEQDNPLAPLAGRGPGRGE
ncbi:MAG: DNA (cytosine-5-)-methyltransferase [Rhodocyclaceae bacterium]|nr:DNA (cytosine-5-)-methyltransferase [Rhodocyclaceae bacterium]